MENDIIEHNATTTPANQPLSIVCILSYIGNGLWLLLLLLAYTSTSIMQDEVLDAFRSSAQMAELTDDQVLGFVKMGIGILVVLCIISLVGAILSHNKKLAGVILYGASALIWGLMMILSFSPISIIIGLISIVFAIIIAVNYNK